MVGMHVTNIRRTIYGIVEGTENDSRASKTYNYAMIFVITLGLLPLTTKEPLPIFEHTETIVFVVFVIDYLCRWITADYQSGKRGIGPFVRYPFTPMAIIDLLSIAPYILTMINSGFIALRFIRLLQALRVFRVFRYSKSFRLLGKVFKDSKEPLIAVCALAASYVFVCALIIFNVEPETFSTFFDAIYWAIISLTTMGYGDIYPVTDIGRGVTMVSAIFGVAIIALPAGILTAGYMNAIFEEHEAKMKEKAEKQDEAR